MYVVQSLMKLLRTSTDHSSTPVVLLAAVAAEEAGELCPVCPAARCSARFQSDGLQVKQRGTAMAASARSSPVAYVGSGTHGVVEHALSLVTHLPLSSCWQ